MRILFEEHQYETQYLDGILQDIVDNIELDFCKKAKMQYVGYFYCGAVNDCVFILPKVLLEQKDDRDIIAGLKHKESDGTERDVTPEEIITPAGQEKYLTEEYRKFIYEFSVWVYRCLDMYRNLNPDENSILYKHLPEAGKGKKHKATTFVEIILSLLQFNRENQDFFIFTIKNNHSGWNKINWNKTIANSSAIIQEGTPIYMDVVNRKKQINFDETLFVIFFSILNYINEHFGFKTYINCNYDILKGEKFERYLHGLGRKRLLQIKYKYFSDKALELWNLCYAFFNAAHQININTQQREYLLSSRFEHVFEAMIDELIGTPKKSIPRGLKDQDDGKKVDHMYTYRDLISENSQDIYYIGDSKYYKHGNKLTRESIYKQYTYARNVIQWNINLFLKEEEVTFGMSEEEKANYWQDRNEYQKINLRHNAETEGYNIIPNFFLSAYVDENRKYDDGKNIQIHKLSGQNATYISYQFRNRLFDRDTLILSHYDVNFLYVLYLYGRNKQAEKRKWRDEVRKIFRDEVKQVVEHKYMFKAMRPRVEGDDKRYLNEHFQNVMGKIFTPYKDKNTYVIGLSKEDTDKEENDALLKELEQYFFITPTLKSIDENPTAALDALGHTISNHYTGKGKCIVVDDNDSDTTATKINATQKYAIGLGDTSGALAVAEGFSSAKYLVIHKLNPHCRGRVPQMLKLC